MRRYGRGLARTGLAAVAAVTGALLAIPGPATAQLGDALADPAPGDPAGRPVTYRTLEIGAQALARPSVAGGADIDQTRGLHLGGAYGWRPVAWPGWRLEVRGRWQRLHVDAPEPRARLGTVAVTAAVLREVALAPSWDLAAGGGAGAGLHYLRSAAPTATPPGAWQDIGAVASAGAEIAWRDLTPLAIYARAAYHAALSRADFGAVGKISTGGPAIALGLRW